MNMVKIIPIINMMILFGAIILENRFGIRISNENSAAVESHSTYWKKWLIRWNEGIRYSGIFMMFIAAMIFAMQVRRMPGEEWFFLLWVVGFGVLIYLLGLSLAVLINKSNTVGGKPAASSEKKN